MEIRIFILTIIIFSGCKSLPTNFKISTEMKEINFFSDAQLYDGFGDRLYHVYIDTFFHLEITNLSGKDLKLYHDNTYVVPNEWRFPIPAFRDDQTVIRYFDYNKEEIYGSFMSISIDSLNADREIFTPEIRDTNSYNIKKYENIKLIQKIKLPYRKNTFFISIDKPTFNNVRFVQFCLSLGKKRKGRLYGCSCSDFINVKHK